MDRIRVLHIARNYPNNVIPTMGLWTQRLVLAAYNALVKGGMRPRTEGYR